MTLMTVNEAADYLRVNRRTVTRRMDAHIYPYYMVGNDRRLCKEEIDEILMGTRVSTMTEIEERMTSRRSRNG